MFFLHSSAFLPILFAFERDWFVSEWVYLWSFPPRNDSGREDTWRRPGRTRTLSPAWSGLASIGTTRGNFRSEKYYQLPWLQLLTKLDVLWLTSENNSWQWTHLSWCSRPDGFFGSPLNFFLSFSLSCFFFDEVGDDDVYLLNEMSPLRSSVFSDLWWRLKL